MLAPYMCVKYIYYKCEVEFNEGASKFISVGNCNYYTELYARKSIILNFNHKYKN